VQNALTPGGGDNILAVIKSLWDEPIDPVTGGWQLPELMRTANEAQFAIDELGTAAKSLGSYMQWDVSK